MEIIDRATREGGAQTRAQLAERVGARYWGPGRFRAALRAAVADGAVRRVGRNTYGPGDGGAATPAQSST